jgi:hypothetical protein
LEYRIKRLIGRVVEFIAVDEAFETESDSTALLLFAWPLAENAHTDSARRHSPFFIVFTS